MSAGQMPSNSQCMFDYHRNASLAFLSGKYEQFGEQWDSGPVCKWWETGGPGLGLVNPDVVQKILRRNLKGAK